MRFSQVGEVREVTERQKHVCNLENQRINKEKCIRKLDEQFPLQMFVLDDVATETPVEGREFHRSVHPKCWES